MFLTVILLMHRITASNLGKTLATKGWNVTEDVHDKDRRVLNARRTADGVNESLAFKTEQEKGKESYKFSSTYRYSSESLGN